MKVVIETIPGDRQRYETAGDYWRDPDGVIQIRVSEMNNERYAALIAIHELIEFLLCDQRGIAEPDIMAFDIAHEGDHEPGEHPDAPYRKEHAFAECIERLIAHEFGIDWAVYSNAAEATF